MYGISETKEVVKFGIELGEAFDKGLSDGKFSIEDLSYFFSTFMSAGAAFEGISKVPAEIKDLSSEEMEDLKAFVELEFDIENDKLEELIEKALGVALKIYEIIALFKSGIFKKDEEVIS